MNTPLDLEPTRNFFREKLEVHGATTRAMDYNSTHSQEIRFEQLVNVILKPDEKYTLIDYGCGYGALYDYLLKKGHNLDYSGYDILEEMVRAGRAAHDQPNCRFTSDLTSLPTADYVVASGVFNKRFEANNEEWTAYLLDSIAAMNRLSSKGFSFNCLTGYSDASHMRPDLYYADPLFLFDHCKQNYAKNVALLHDYGIYDFTILVRKERD
jgi:SAM-dependent methyltransferase